MDYINPEHRRLRDEPTLPLSHEEAVIAARLSKFGHRVTPETIYLAYTVGITAYLRDGIEAASPAKVEASNRVGNLYRRK